MKYFQIAAGVLSFAFFLCAEMNVHAEVVATVNGKPITTDDAQMQFLLKQVPKENQTSQTEMLVNNLIERRLIADFLQKKNVKADQLKLEHQMTLVRKLIEKKEEKLVEVLARLNLTEESLLDYLKVNLAWEAYVNQTVTQQEIADYFKTHRPKLDGTRLEAAQIVIVLNSSSDPQAWIDAETKLTDVRQQILSGKLSFSEAAQKYSDSPSGKNGGDLGKFEHTGRLPQSITDIAFSLKLNEISQPFRTSFGVHLVVVKQIIPGQLSLEDARPEIVKLLSQKVWDEQVAVERAKVEIRLGE